MADTIRIVVCGDEGVGKSSLITCLIKDTFRTSAPIQPTIPPLTITTPSSLTTTIVDTSSLPADRATLRKEIRRGNVILLVYSDHYSYERVSLFWLPLFRSLGVNLPVVLCANKSDLYHKDGWGEGGPDDGGHEEGGGDMGGIEGGGDQGGLEKEMLPIMLEFKEIDSCVRASAKEMRNVVEAFYLCQRAVTNPVAPVFDAKERGLKPACVAALERVFFLCDRDQDGLLNDAEIQEFQRRCFNKPLLPADLEEIKTTIRRVLPEGATDEGISRAGFILLNKIFAEKGRHETIWSILRTFHYTDSLSLKDSFLHPPFSVPENSSAELSPLGYRFFVDLFLLFDKDNDGGLSPSELTALFAPTPGLPQSWIEANFPLSTVRSETGHITLQGWLAQWSMTTYIDPTTTLEYLAYLGFEHPSGTTAALKLTKPRRKKRRQAKVDRNVVSCYIVGSPGCGKSTILDVFLNRPTTDLSYYNPTIKLRTAVNSVEMAGGKQCYLILTELGTLEPAVLSNPALLSRCDVLCYAYDSSDPSSFSHITSIREKYKLLPGIPAVFAACKADLDKTMQRAEVQPEEYTRELGMSAPLHVSAAWTSGKEELFACVAEAALRPEGAMPRVEGKGWDWGSLLIGVGVGVGVLAVGWGVWRRGGV